LYELHVGHPQEAIEECNAALRASADPKVQAAAWSGVGQAQLQLHHYDQAADSYRNALRLNPEDGGALIGTGLLALRQGESDLAVTQFFHAVKVDPSDANVLLYAQALRRDGRTAEADSALAQVQKISSDLGQAQFDAGQFLSFAGLKPL
jgi:tetratricopeptide (TPR) repeat protein